MLKVTGQSCGDFQLAVCLSRQDWYRIVGFFEGKNFHELTYFRFSRGKSSRIIQRALMSLLLLRVWNSASWHGGVVRSRVCCTRLWSAAVGSLLPCLQERFDTHDSYAIGFTALLTASIHNSGTELANDPLELGKIALSHVSNIWTTPLWFPAVNISREKFSRMAINSWNLWKFSLTKKTRYTVFDQRCNLVNSILLASVAHHKIL